MSTFNYRVTRQGDQFAIREVFYDDHGRVNGWTASPLSVSCSSVTDLRHELELYVLALDDSVVEIAESNDA